MLLNNDIHKVQMEFIEVAQKQQKHNIMDYMNNIRVDLL